MLRPALSLLLVLTFISGVLYPLAITGVAQMIFPHQANGSLIERDGAPIGSSLVGQAFADPGRFWPRPSATGPRPYTAFNGTTLTGSSGSNWGTTAPELVAGVQERIAELNAGDAAVGLVRQPGALIPVDLVTASASGLDPAVSPAGAEYQIPRIAKATGLSEQTLRAIVRQHTIAPFLGVFGEPAVNVLEANLEIIDTLASGNAH